LNTDAPFKGGKMKVTRMSWRRPVSMRAFSIVAASAGFDRAMPAVSVDGRFLEKRGKYANSFRILDSAGIGFAAGDVKRCRQAL
jgi:hypothetical protein